MSDDSDQAIGAVKAIQDAGRDDILLVAPGTTNQGLELLKKEGLSMISYQSCQNDAGLAVRTMAEFFNGEEISRVAYTQTTVIDSENIAEYLPAQW